MGMEGSIPFLTLHPFRRDVFFQTEDKQEGRKAPYSNAQGGARFVTTFILSRWNSGIIKRVCGVPSFETHSLFGHRTLGVSLGERTWIGPSLPSEDLFLFIAFWSNAAFKIWGSQAFPCRTFGILPVIFQCVLVCL